MYYFRCKPDGQILQFDVDGVVPFHSSGLAKFGSCSIILLTLNESSTGEYSCEVSLDFPFNTKTKETHMEFVNSTTIQDNIFIEGGNFSTNVFSSIIFFCYRSRLRYIRWKYGKTSSQRIKYEPIRTKVFRFIVTHDIIPKYISKKLLWILFECEKQQTSMPESNLNVQVHL